MRLNWRQRIHTTFTGWKLWLFIIVSLLALFFVAFQGYVISKQSTRKIEEQYNRIIAGNMDSLSVNISSYLNYMDDFARTLSNNPDLIDAFRPEGDGTKKRTEEQLRIFSEYYHVRLPLNIQLYDNMGNVYSYPSINVWEEKKLVETITTFAWFKQRVTLDNDYLHWNVTADFRNDQFANGLYVSKNIIHNNRSLGILIIEMNGALIERMLNRARINAENSVLIVSGDGEPLFRNEQYPSSLDMDSSVLQAAIRHARTNNSDSGTQVIKLANTDYCLILKPISSTPWTMMSLIPLSSLYTDSLTIWRTTAITTALSILFIITFFFILYAKVTLPVQQLSHIVRHAGEGMMPKAYTYKGFKEIETLNRGIFRFFEQIQEQFQTIKRGEEEKRKLELHMLQEQMRPHFWHNSLNSLRFLALLEGSHTMAEAIVSLTRMLDYTLKNTDVRYSTLEEEKEYAMRYIRFQEIRSMQHIRVELDLDERTRQAQIPKFTLQPMMENAVAHGFAAPFDRDPLIRVETRLREGMLVIRITDNGNGIDGPTVEQLLTPGRKRDNDRRSSGLSLLNLQQRLRLEYGDCSGIHIDSRIDRYTQITITLPLTTSETSA